MRKRHAACFTLELHEIVGAVLTRINISGRPDVILVGVTVHGAARCDTTAMGLEKRWRYEVFSNNRLELRR